MDGMTMTTATAAAAAASSTMSMNTMMGGFQTNIGTSLYSTAWTPNSAGAYAATCLFLVLLGIIFRGLLAFKTIQERKWLDKELARRYVVVNGRQPISEQVSTDSLAKRMTLTENGVEENVMVVERKHTPSRPWRFSTDPVRAVIDMVIAGVGYLLMLAVMTMNVGYFMAVLAGTFLGSLICGRYSIVTEH